MRYRPEIDGLRTVAVLPVILFHAGFNVFRGGYVGVDVFFVISGYLITTIILSELEAGTFSIARFYERRARRILPALFTVILCCLPFAYLWMLPDQLEAFSKSIIAVVFFASNFLFWSEEGYFAAASELKPLLHTWSLAVEEQYYLLFPLFLMALWKFGKQRLLFLILALSLCSLSLSEWGWRNYAGANFFLAPSRIWELLTGSICAFLLFDKNPRPNNLGSLTGLALIVYAIFFFHDHTPFPSIYTLVPVLGTALVILFGREDTLVAKILSTRAFVGIGLISYSAYLWHQPLFAFARIRSLQEPDRIVMTSLAVTALLLAWITWRFVEQPFRKRNPPFPKTQKRVFIASGVVGVIFVLAASLVLLRNGLPERLNIPESVYASLKRTEREDECFMIGELRPDPDWYCSLGVKGQKPNFVLFGDSHALSVLPAFDHSAKTLGLAGTFAGFPACPPFLGIYVLRGEKMQESCHTINQRMLEYVKKEEITTIFLVARWAYYTTGGYEARKLTFLSLEEDGTRRKSVSRRAFMAGLEKTLREYEALGVDVIIVPQVPQQIADPRALYFLMAQSFTSDIVGLSVSREKHNRLQRIPSRIFSKFNVTTLSLDDALCRQDHCPFGTENVSYYLDDDHLSLAGSALVEPLVETFLRERFSR